MELSKEGYAIEIFRTKWHEDLHTLPWIQDISVASPKTVNVTLLTDGGEIDISKLMKWDYDDKILHVQPKFTNVDNIIGLATVKLGNVKAAQLKIIVR